jgi:hypothetical protein
MPAVLVSDSLSLENFKVVAETHKRLQKELQSVKYELDDLLIDINEHVLAPIPTIS